MRIELLTEYRAMEDDEYRGRFPDGDFKYQVGDEDTLVMYRGVPQFVFRKAFFDAEKCARFHRMVYNKIDATDQRSYSSGQKPINRLTKRGRFEKIKRSNKSVYSGIAGYYEAAGLNKYPRACAFNKKHPRVYEYLIENFVDKIQKFYAEDANLRQFHDKQLEFANRIKKDLIIPNTVFSTITMNKNFQTSYHKDAGDFKEGMSTIFVVKNGKYVGGGLCVPEFDIQFNLGNGDLLFFNPHYVHGNKKITPLSADATRLSFVTYLRTGLANVK